MIIRKSHLKLNPSAHAPFVSALIIPTGVGADQGGYAGDAGVILRLIASVSDYVITHPNVCNAAGFVTVPDNVLYVEGAMLDAWLRGQIALHAVRSNTIGVIFDAGIPQNMQVLHQNVISAMRTVHGLDILPPVVTYEPLQLRCTVSSKSQASGGGLDNPEVLLQAAERCLDQGASAIAICGYFDGLSQHLDEASYKTASGVDPIGGLEAILSHLVTQAFGVASAHAPILSLAESQPETSDILPGKIAAEYITPTFLPCVLQGLSRAPQMIPSRRAQAGDISVECLNALITPANALGGPGTLAALMQQIPVIAVASNTTTMNVTPQVLAQLLPDSVLSASSLRPAHNYLEAVGHLQALKLGLQLP
ncbi:MAG: DUF3326 domain-containing protein [Vampirovibrionales bacterium]|nr:DUF3326 domain-containing protein [Vampirovibrionales bacterium]